MKTTIIIIIAFILGIIIGKCDFIIQEEVTQFKESIPDTIRIREIELLDGWYTFPYSNDKTTYIIIK